MNLDRHPLFDRCRRAARKLSALLKWLACAAAAAVFGMQAAGAAVLGIDVSWYNGSINWPGMANSGIKFAYLRATESTYVPDAAFAQNVAGATSQQIAVGAYHFGTPLFSAQYYQPGYDRVTTPETEADNFLLTARGAIGVGHLPPVLDVEAQVVTWTLVYGEYVATMWVDPMTGESWDGANNPLPKQPAMGAAALAQWIKQWTTRVYQQTNVMPIVYTDLYHANALYPYLGKTVKLWISDITRAAGNPATVGQPNWSWLFHQYSWSGSIAGNSPIDQDIFNGDQAAFDALLRGESTDPVALVFNGSGGGSVGSSPAGLNCSANCNVSYKTGTSVTLWAIPDYGSTFTGWSGDCSGTGICVLDMNTPKNVTATFSLPASQPIYRFFNTAAGGHFFTMAESEKNYVIANVPTLHYEGIGFNGYSSQVPGALPVYRFFNTITGGHFFTADEGEKATVLANSPWLHLEGVGFYAYTSQMRGSQPVYRFYNNIAGGHFFTMSVQERNFVIANLPWFGYEGIGFYAREASQ